MNDIHVITNKIKNEPYYKKVNNSVLLNILASQYFKLNTYCKTIFIKCVTLCNKVHKVTLINVLININ